MSFVFLLGLTLAGFHARAERAAEAQGAALGTSGAPALRSLRLSDAAGAQVARLLAPEPLSREEAWLPTPGLRFEEEGASGAHSHLSLLSGSGRIPSDEQKEPRISPGPLEELLQGREAVLEGRSPIWFLLDPLDAVVGLENIRVSWGKGGSEVSVTTQLSRWMESLGTPLDRSVFLGLNVDLLGFEEYDATRLAMIDAHHGIARVNYLSTGFGLTFKF